MVDRVGQQLDKYRLMRLLGRGGFADVYLGEHVYLKTQAAIKVLRERILDEDDLDKFLKEAQAIAQLDHDHIIHVRDFGIHDEVPYLVMDYAPNGTLRQRYPRSMHVPLTNVVAYLEQIAGALQYAHNMQFIHQDIKPENILLKQDNTILLSDFGLATVARHTSSQKTEYAAGTAMYMSPEQFRGKPRQASDQYALGVMVYEWLCGEPPFTDGDFIQLGFQHTYIPVPPLRERVPALSEDAEHIILTALAKEAKERFASVTAFANAFAQATGHRQTTNPLVIPRPSTPPAEASASPLSEGKSKPLETLSSVEPVRYTPAVEIDVASTPNSSIPELQPQAQVKPVTEPQSDYDKPSPEIKVVQKSKTEPPRVRQATEPVQKKALSPAPKMPAPSPAEPLQVKQPAKPSMPAARAATPSPSSSREVHAWSFGRNEIIVSVVCVVVSMIIIASHKQSFILFGAPLTLVIIWIAFSGVAFGPWVGALVGASTAILSHILFFSSYAFSWPTFYGSVALGFIAGLAQVFIARKGDYLTWSDAFKGSIFGGVGIVMYFVIFLGMLHAMNYFIEDVWLNVIAALISIPVVAGIFNRRILG